MVELERPISKFQNYNNIFNFRNVMSMIPSVLLAIDTMNICYHVSIDFIIPSSLHVSLKKTRKYPFLTS